MNLYNDNCRNHCENPKLLLSVTFVTKHSSGHTSDFLLLFLFLYTQFHSLVFSTSQNLSQPPVIFNFYPALPLLWGTTASQDTEMLQMYCCMLLFVL